MDGDSYRFLSPGKMYNIYMQQGSGFDALIIRETAYHSQVGPSFEWDPLSLLRHANQRQLLEHLFSVVPLMSPSRSYIGSTWGESLGTLFHRKPLTDEDVEPENYGNSTRPASQKDA